MGGYLAQIRIERGPPAHSLAKLKLQLSIFRQLLGVGNWGESMIRLH